MTRFIRRIFPRAIAAPTRMIWSIVAAVRVRDHDDNSMPAAIVAAFLSALWFLLGGIFLAGFTR